MLRPLGLVDQFNEIERELPDDWADARLLLTVTDDARSDRAAALLGPANPGRLGKKIHFTVGRRGTGVGSEAMRRLLKRLDDEGVVGKLELLGAEKAPAEEFRRRESLREAWERALASLPADWSDIYAEVRFDSTDYVERAALLLAPLNPARYGGATALRFRCARTFGYGVSPEMAARCMERCDEEGLTGEVEILRALSDTYPVATQGPVWLVGGRAV
jgi:GNAT superfamily N-acetyltransferase